MGPGPGAARLDARLTPGALKISPESALHFLGKLVREGKATISSIRATETMT